MRLPARLLFTLFPAVLSGSSFVEAAPVASIKKEIYVPNAEPHKAPWVWVYSGKPGYREEIHTVWSHDDQVRGYGDSPTLPRRRVSHDDGKTWTPLTPLPPMMTFLDKVSILDWEFCGIYDPASKRHVALSIHHVRDMREGPPRRIYNHSSIRTSADGGKTFGPPQMLRYEDGAEFDPDDVLHPDFLSTNNGYPGQSILKHSNGSLIVPVTNSNIPDDVEGKLYWIGNIQPVNPIHPGHPRYPLIIAEVDEDSLGLIRDTVTEIDTRQKGEGEMMQLSNFWIIESEEEKNLEIYLTRLYENPDEMYTANVYRYALSFP